MLPRVAGQRTQDARLTEGNHIVFARRGEAYSDGGDVLSSLNIAQARRNRDTPIQDNFVVLLFV